MWIFDIDLSATSNDITEAFEEEKMCVNDPGNFSCEIKKLNTTSSTVNYHAIRIRHNGLADTEAMIIMDMMQPDDYVFKKLNLKGVSHEFYKPSCDNDCNQILVEMLVNLAKKNAGTVAMMFNEYPIIIKEGDNTRQARSAVIDDDGNVYSSGNGNIKKSFDTSGLSINKPLNEFMQENPELAKMVKDAKCASMNDAMNIIGKYVMNAKLNDNINADEFNDIFMQAGAIGFTDKTCVMLYKLLT